MSTEEGLTRRQVLVLLGAGGALALGGLTAVGDGDGAPAEELDLALRALGEAVLVRHPTLLGDGGALGGAVAPDEVVARPAEALRALQGRVRDDHGEGRVLDVDGWVLSRTECYLAALYARG